jgi:hypothetical protein
MNGCASLTPGDYLNVEKLLDQATRTALTSVSMKKANRKEDVEVQFCRIEFLWHKKKSTHKLSDCCASRDLQWMGK